MNASVNPVDAALAAAKAQAAQTPAPVAQGGAVSNYEPARRFTTDDLSGSGLNPDIYVSIDKHGLAFKGKDGLVDSVEVAIDTVKGIHIFEALRFGDPVQYLKTYDGVRCEQGGSWEAAVKRAQIADPKARPYQGGDLAMEVLEDTKNTKGAVILEKGTVLGLSTSVTARANLKAFTDAYKAAGLEGKVVLVKLSVEQKSNAKGAWGLPVFTLLGEYNPDQA